MERKAAVGGANLIAMDEVRQAAATRFTERAATQAELDTVVQLLQSRGLVYRLDPRPGVTWVLLKPERINQYGASIIQAARNHPLGIGAVAERDVLVGNLTFAGFERLPQSEEALVLEATAELLIRHDLGFREMGYLVFPSQINVTRLPPSEAHPRTEVAYRFSGGIETIYASLVVRLSYTDYFRREDQWKYAVEFSRDGNRLGFSMRQVEEGTGELEIYFYPGISEFDRVTFIRFVTDHLRVKGIDIQEQIRLYCPKCAREVTDREAIEARVQDGKLDIACQVCDTAVVIPRSVEEIYRRDPALGEKQQQLAETVEQRTAAEVEQFRADQRQYTAAEEHGIHILHLSDLHLGDDALAGIYRAQLETDLIQELGIRRLEYLVISGDVAVRSTEEEYRAAFALVDGLVKRFGLDASRVVVVPGNHDLNWDLSEDGVSVCHQGKLPAPLPDGSFHPGRRRGRAAARRRAVPRAVRQLQRALLPPRLHRAGLSVGLRGPGPLCRAARGSHPVPGAQLLLADRPPLPQPGGHPHARAGGRLGPPARGRLRRLAQDRHLAPPRRRQGDDERRVHAVAGRPPLPGLPARPHPRGDRGVPQVR